MVTEEQASEIANKVAREALDKEQADQAKAAADALKEAKAAAAEAAKETET